MVHNCWQPYLGLSWTDSHQIWAVDVIHHAPPTHGIQNAEMQKKVFCDVIASVLYIDGLHTYHLFYLHHAWLVHHKKSSIKLPRRKLLYFQHSLHFEMCYRYNKDSMTDAIVKGQLLGDLTLFITTLTLGPVLFLGLSCASFFAAASMALAALSNSFSAITLGSSGSIQSDPVWLGQRSNICYYHDQFIAKKAWKYQYRWSSIQYSFYTLYVIYVAQYYYLNV